MAAEAETASGSAGRRWGQLLLLNVLMAAVYAAAAVVGMEQELVRGQVTPLWPPTGVALAGLLFWGTRCWPGITLGAFLVNVPLGPNLLVTLAIAAGNTLAPLASRGVLLRVGFRPELDRLRDALALVFPGALGGMLVSATVGTGALTLSEALSATGFWPTWWVWWTGDAMGVLIVAPVLFTLRHARWPVALPPYRWAEAGVLLAGTALVTLLVTHSSMSLLFLVTPFLLWAAFRFQLAGAAPCALIISVVTITAASGDVGPFADHNLFERMFMLQLYNGATALTALVLSALVTERNTTQQQIALVCEELSDMVAALDSDDATRRDSPPPDRPEGQG